MAQSIDVRDDQLPRGAGTAGEVVPVAAASILLLRGDPLQVLMIRRHERSTFVPNAWVFPGGALEEADRALGDGTDLGALRVAAVRELFEETGVWLGDPLRDAAARRAELLRGEVAFAALAAEAPLAVDSMVWTSRWITPVGSPKRFDTCFFLAPAPADAVAVVDATEAIDVTWIRPADALVSLQLVFPTMKNLEAIAGFTSIEELLASRRGATIRPVQPVLVIENGQKKLVLPD